MRRSVISAVALVAATQFIGFGSAQQAQALGTCYETGCNGKPAASYTCVNDAEIIYNVNLYNPEALVQIAGNLQLKYSPSCRVVWARVISNIGGGGDAGVFNTQDTYNTEDCQITGPAGTGCNTPMLNDGGKINGVNVTSRAAADIYLLDGTLVDAETGAY